MRLLISIHDVTPALEPNVRRLWELCRERGAVPALFVVPNWHGAWPLAAYPKFCAWLRQCAAAGAEIVLHGERHDEIGASRSWRDELRAWGRTAREGEFLSLDRPAARERIERGLATLAALGFEVRGFVPPAWLATEDTHRAARDAGLWFSEDAGALRRLQDETRIPAPAVRWSARTPLRALGSVAVAEARQALQGRMPVVRLALHPADLEHPLVAHSVARALDRWLAQRPPARYCDVAHVGAGLALA